MLHSLPLISYCTNEQSLILHKTDMLLTKTLEAGTTKRPMLQSVLVPVYITITPIVDDLRNEQTSNVYPTLHGNKGSQAIEIVIRQLYQVI